MKNIFFCIALFASFQLNAQLVKPKFSIAGTAGVTYDYYGLTVQPKTPSFYTARRPWHLVRFSFQPAMSFGDFKLPFNINFSPMRNNFGSPPYGFGSLPGFPKQTFLQWITNPMNSIGINPSYKWAELQLGTQYLKYSDLSTGDIGAFGYGISLKPGKFRFKFFRGISQQAFQSYTVPGNLPNMPPEFPGAYKRTITMGQIGLEKEGKYFAGFNIVKGKDDAGSITTPLVNPPYTVVATPKPAENLIISFVTKFNTQKGWYGQTELATTITSRDNTATPPSPLVKDFKPFINTNTSSYRDHAMQAGFGKKGKDWDIGASMKWLGAGYTTMGYPYVQNDRLEYTVNTRFNAWKKKMNVTASIGQRFGNWSTASRTRQIIANTNVFVQFDDHFSVNANYNNFGFNTPSLLGGVKNVGNDLGINPTYTWSTSTMANLLSLTYNWSKYTETFIFPIPGTSNNTHTALLLYAPSFFNKPDLSADISAMYFSNKSSVPTKLSILSVSLSVGRNFPKKKINLRGQLMYSNTTIDPKTPGNNIMATLGVDWKVSKKLSWNTSITGNFNKYGNELDPPPSLIGASYLESSLHTALLYRFGK
jgi:hypothetical protein